MKRLKNLSISKKLYLIVGAMALLITVELFTLWFALTSLSAVRALVGAEGLYSKAQKDGLYQLAEYSRTHREADYQKFFEFMKVPLGDHKTRMELAKENPDLNVARQGFAEGRIHSSDIGGVITLLRRFHKQFYINKAIEIWTRGDSLISLLIPIAESIHGEINSPAASTENLNKLIDQISPLNAQLTLLEDDFSFTLGEGSRWLENFILKLLFAVALTVEITGLIMTILVSRSISRGLKEITNVTNKVATGDLSARARIFSKDEIGQVAAAVNEMTNQLTSSNNELSQFAYIASHDLQEPLRTISNYSGLFLEQYSGRLEPNAEKYLDAILRATTRMQLLIKDILDYSQIGASKTRVRMDCNILLKELLEDMAVTIKENNVRINIGYLPPISCYPEIRAVFQNMISNGIKFRKNDIQPVIDVNAKSLANDWIFSVADNGIGIEKIYYERIFTIFQKLHSRKEYPGSGIGLAHCRKIIELHGGKIWVESESGKGSTFYFTIPKIANG